MLGSIDTAEQQNLIRILNCPLSLFVLISHGIINNLRGHSLNIRTRTFSLQHTRGIEDEVLHSPLRLVRDASILVLVWHLETVSIPLVSTTRALFLDSAVVLTFTQVHTSCHCGRNHIHHPFLRHQLGNQRLLLENNLRYRPKYHNRSKRMVY